MADLLADPENEGLTAEELGERAIDLLDSLRAKTQNLIVVGRFGFEDTLFEAALGPLSTRAPVAARELGQRFAYDYKTKVGHGVFKLLPILRTPAAAWDYARQQVTPAPKGARENPHLPLQEAVQRQISEAMAWEPNPDVLKSLRPACTCALRNQVKSSTGSRFQTGPTPVMAPCARHPERNPHAGPDRSG
jgi:hypothetical protein